MAGKKLDLFWVLLPIGVIIALVGGFYRKRQLESFDWLVIIVLGIMLFAKLVEWVYRRFNNKTSNAETEVDVVDDKN